MINRIKQLIGLAPERSFKVISCETRIVDSSDGAKPAIFIAGDLYQTSKLDAMIAEMIEKFNVQRMVSPPETSLLLVTIIGPCTAADAARIWRAKAAANEITLVFMKRMEKADVGVAPAGNPREQAFESILPDQD